jgi:Carboxypeptidase regulatory-like domain
MKKFASHALSVFLMALCVFMAANWASAQVNTADILGTVTDAGGAVIPNVKVTVVNSATNDTKTTTTGSNGDYIFNLMIPGQYTLTVEAPSFKKATVNLAVSAGDRARSNVQLQVGDVTQTVEVAAQTPALQTDSATLSTIVAAQSVQDLPLNGRNFVTLVQSTVGVAVGPSNSILSGTRPDERRQTANISANGQNEVFNNQLIDGMDNNEREQFTLLMRPSIDMIQEVKVDTNSYPAELGRAGGAVINLLTKSGSNDFHGGLYEYLRNDKLNANDFFSNKTGVARPAYRQNQYGGSLGGRIIKDKTFFFGDYEALKIRSGKPTGLIFTPTAFELANVGNFSDVGGPIIPDSQQDPVAKKYWKLWPSPTIACPTGTLCANYNGNVQSKYNSTTYDARIDHRFSDRDSIFGRFSYNPTFNSQPALFPDVTVDGLKLSAGGGIFPGPSDANSQGYMVDFVHIISPTMVMELKGAFTRLWLYTAAPNIGTNASAKFGMPNTDLTDQISGLATIDIVPMRGVGSSFTLGDDRFVPIFDVNNVFQEQGSLTWTRGAHNIKMGAGLIRRQVNYYQNTFGLGYFRFTQDERTDLVNFIQGKPDQIQRQVNPKRQYFRFWEPNIYVQDDWRANSWLHVNIGLRWDYFTPITAAQGERSSWDPALAGKCTPAACNPFNIGARAGVKSYWTNFEPRLGFAATPRQGLVVRGGFGMSRFAQDFASGSMNLYNPPFIPLNLDCNTSSGVGCPNNAPGWRLQQGAPPVIIPPINNQLPGTVGAHAVDYPQAYIMQWNLTVQKQFGANVVSAGYVGQIARHLQYAPNINVPAPSQNGLKNYLPRVYSGVMPNLASINYYTATGASEYNAAQFSFERRYAKGLTANVNYTFARNLTNISDGGTTGAATVGSILPYDRSYDWGNSDIGIKNRLSFRVNYELPFGKSGSRMHKLAVGGWQLNMLAFYQSGVPFTVINNVTPVASNVSDLVTVDRPNVVAGQSYVPDNQDYNNWINVNKFAAQPVGKVGNESRTQLYGPKQRSADVSIFKDFQLLEKMKLQFRAEVYNITNTENFGQPNIGINKWSATLPGVATGAPGATPVLGAGGFGQITQSNLALNPRQYQFALKLIF